MKQQCLLLFALLLTQSFGEEANVLPRKSNMVTTYIDKIMNKIFLQLATSNLRIEEVNLGEEIGKFTDISIKAGSGDRSLEAVQSYGFELYAGLKEFVIEGNYDVKNLDVPGLLPFYGKGKFRIFLGLVEINMKLTALYNGASGNFDINLPNFEINVENSTVKFENLMDDPHIADFLNELLSNLLPDVVKTLSKYFIEAGQPLIEYFGNGIIKCIKAGIFLGNTDKCIKDLFFPPENLQNGLKFNIDLSNLLEFEL